MPKSPPNATIDRDALDRAQEIAFDAMEASSPAQRTQLARMALVVSAFCSDGYVVLAGDAANPAQRIDLYRQAVAAGEAILDPELAAEGEGQLWLFMEARPYMRALHGLAVALGENGELAEAILLCQQLLRLNENDNQGIRFILMDFLLATDRDADAKALWSRFADDDFAAWAWSAVLLAYRAKSPEAADRLRDARASNRHVQAYLTGAKKMPGELPDYYSPGEPSEAISYVLGAKAAWARTPGAIEWLKGSSPR